MRKVRCYECGKSYNYEEDAFCPHCGAFNQAPRGSGAGTAVRVDGLRESGHSGSFLHQEYHREERVRKHTGLEKKAPRAASSKLAGQQRAAVTKKERGGREVDMSAVLRWIVIAFVLLQFLIRLF